MSQIVYVVIALNKDPTDFIMGVFWSMKAARDARKTLVYNGYDAGELYVQEWEVRGTRGRQRNPRPNGKDVQGVPGVLAEVPQVKH